MALKKSKALKLAVVERYSARARGATAGRGDSAALL